MLRCAAAARSLQLSISRRASATALATSTAVASASSAMNKASEAPFMASRNCDHLFTFCVVAFTTKTLAVGFHRAVLKMALNAAFRLYGTYRCNSVLTSLIVGKLFIFIRDIILFGRTATFRIYRNRDLPDDSTSASYFQTLAPWC